MNTEDKIRELMRSFDIKCPSCGSDHINIEKEQDTECGIMDEAVCTDCVYDFIIVSGVHTYLV